MNLFDRYFGDIYNNSMFHNQSIYPSRPFWTMVLTEDEELIREDILNRYRAYYALNYERIQRMRYNIFTYAGLHLFPDDIQIRATEGLAPQLVETSPRLTSQNAKRLVHERVTTEMLYPADIAVVPNDTDFQASIEAEAVKAHLDSIDQLYSSKRHRELMFRRKNLCGEAYRYIYWEKDAGGIHPTYKKRKDEGKSVTITLPNGDRKEVTRPIYNGEVGEAILQTWDVGLEPTTFAGYCQWGFHRYWRSVDELQVDYPDVADEILPSDRGNEWCPDMMQTIPLKDYVLVIEFYHRRNPYLPEGYKVVMTPDVILEHGPNPYAEAPSSELGEIPYERLTDLDVDGSLHAISSLQHVTPLINQYDQVVTRAGMNLYLGSLPKWIVPKGSVNVTRLANKATVVQYAGPTAPVLATFPTVPQELFAYRDMMKQDMDSNYGSSAIARGEPPKGVTANAALQFLDLQQQEANSLPQLKADVHLLMTYEKRFAVMQQFYDKSDKRTSKILGPERKWMAREFDIRSLERPYNFLLQVSSDLPTRKDARMQVVFQMSQIWPQLFPPEAVADMFKLGHIEKFLSSARAAWQAAEYENYLISRGDKVHEPAEYEDLIAHWKSHYRQKQSPQYRFWPEDRQREHDDHLLMTEFLMLKKARSNIIFAQQVQGLQVWPALLPLPPDFGRPFSPQPPQLGGGPEMPQGGLPQSADNADINQQRFPDGKFGQGVSPIMGAA